ncbi:MAG TPA: hypothetical protein VFS40_08140 [Gemmatimonadales bacterium]|nr:hypothetical protein [Gemmatimonadales bacterium]
MSPSRPLVLAALLAAGLAGGGCSLFPSHEEVWTPIPTRLGTRAVSGADTAWVLTQPGAGYEVITRSRERLPDVKPDLDLAARAFRRYFGTAPKTVALVLADSLTELERTDTLSAHERGAPIVRLVVPKELRRRRAYQSAPIGGLAAARVARAWIRAQAGDSVRLPRWVLEGATGLVAEPALQEFSIEALRRRSKLVQPLPAFFAAGPAGVDSVTTAPVPVDLRKLKRQQRDSLLAYRAQAVAVAQFLADRSGPLVVGRLVEAFRTTRDPAAALAAAGVTPAQPDSLDTVWRAWLQQRDRQLGIRPEGVGR